MKITGGTFFWINLIWDETHLLLRWEINVLPNTQYFFCVSPLYIDKCNILNRQNVCIAVNKMPNFCLSIPKKSRKTHGTFTPSGVCETLLIDFEKVFYSLLFNLRACIWIRWWQYSTADSILFLCHFFGKICYCKAPFVRLYCVW